jgi:hypothetical protein
MSTGTLLQKPDTQSSVVQALLSSHSAAPVQPVMPPPVPDALLVLAPVPLLVLPPPCPLPPEALELLLVELLSSSLSKLASSPPHATAPSASSETRPLVRMVRSNKSVRMSLVPFPGGFPPPG